VFALVNPLLLGRPHQFRGEGGTDGPIEVVVDSFDGLLRITDQVTVIKAIILPGIDLAPELASDDDSFLSQPWLGASWEGFVIEQVLGLFEQRGREVGAYYLRTSDQREIDLVLDLGSRLWAIEIKLTSSPSPGDMEKLNRHADLIKADKRILISRTRHDTSNGRQTSCGLPWFSRAVGEL
jgi:hypothetical protein